MFSGLKRILFFIMFFSLAFSFFPEGDDLEISSDDSRKTFLNIDSENENENESESEAYSDLDEFEYPTDEITIPSKKRPKTPESEKIQDAEKKDEGGEEKKQYIETLNFGTASEISSTVDKITENDDFRFTDELYDLFYKTNNNDVKIKIMDYFAKQKDPCLEDYAVEILSDPYDTSKSVVEKCFNYVSEVKTKEANPALVKLLDQGDDAYFNGALSALGKTGGEKEALYLAKYLERDDLTVPQRQTLMRTLGQMNARSTFSELAKIAQDEDENSFVRMYAAESIGNMKNKDAIPILLSLYSEGDPNMRQYCIRGLKNFPDDEKAKNAILEGIRDDHYKVRIESIKAATELEMKEAVPYLVYRSKNDSENVVKKESFSSIAKLDTSDGNEFLLEQLKDKKVSDATKKNICEALMEKGTGGEDEILNLAKETLKDDKRKSLRSELGKLFIKYARPGYAEICALYLESNDSTTINQGLDLYKNGRYEMARPKVKALAENPKTKTQIKDKAKKLLGIEDSEDQEEKSNSNTSEADAK